MNIHATLCLVGPDRSDALRFSLLYLAGGVGALRNESMTNNEVLAEISGCWVRVVYPVGAIMIRFCTNEDKMAYFRNNLEELMNKINFGSRRVASPGDMIANISEAGEPLWMDSGKWHSTVQYNVHREKGFSDKAADSPTARFVDQVNRVLSNGTQIEVHSSDEYVLPGAGAYYIINRIYANSKQIHNDRVLADTVDDACRNALNNEFGNGGWALRSGSTLVGPAPDDIEEYICCMHKNISNENVTSSGVVVVPVWVKAECPTDLYNISRIPNEFAVGSPLRVVYRIFGKSAVLVFAGSFAGSNVRHIGVEDVRRLVGSLGLTLLDEDHVPSPVVHEGRARMINAAGKRLRGMSLKYEIDQTQSGRFLKVLELVGRSAAGGVNVVAVDGMWKPRHVGGSRYHIGKGYATRITWTMERQQHNLHAMKQTIRSGLNGLGISKIEISDEFDVA